MSSDSDLVELTTAPHAFGAEWVVGALEGFGIVAVTFGEALADDFAMSQKVLGLGGGVRVMVRRDDLERAKEALEEIRTQHPTPEEFETAVEKAADDPDAETEENPDEPTN